MYIYPHPLEPPCHRAQVGHPMLYYSFPLATLFMVLSQFMPPSPSPTACLFLPCLKIDSEVYISLFQSPYIWINMFFSFWLTSLYMTYSVRFIHLIRLTQFRFFPGWVILHCVYIYHNLFIKADVSGHLGCIQIMAIVNCAAMNSGANVSFTMMGFPRYMATNGLRGHILVLFLVFKGISRLFSTVAV